MRPGDVTSCAATVATTAIETKEAADAVEAAREALAKETALYEADDKRAQKVVLAEKALSRAQGIHAKRLAEDRAARTALATAERDQTRRDLRISLANLASWTDGLRPALDALVECDRAIDGAALDLVVAVNTAASIWMTAADQAGRVGEDFRIPRPTLADAKLALQRRLLASRTAEARDDLSGWLTSADGSWKVSNATAAELASNERGAVLARREEAELALARARYEGANAKPVETPTVEPVVLTPEMAAIVERDLARIV